ncbi:MAG: metallophosphoesterase [Chloroflexi bacterium]|nr:metallophosphoesterase [Chloroflexota bacterium]
MTNEAKAQIRVLHTSDIHLDDYSFTNDGRHDGRPGGALKALVDLSIQESANLVVIVGDLFDYNRVDTDTVLLTIDELRRVPAPVIVLPGNHDCLGPDSVYQRVFFPGLASNIHVITGPKGERLSFPELDLAIWGKPVNSEGNGFRPMAGIPPRSGERWQLAVAHGYYVVDLRDRMYSLQISEEEIAGSFCDYVALGHSAGYRCVYDGVVKAYYSGSPSMDSMVVLVDLHREAGVRVSTRQLSF